MVIPPDGAVSARPIKKRRIGAKPGSRRPPRVAPPLPQLTPEATEAAIDILPPELAALYKLLPPDFELPPDILAAMVLPRVPLANAVLTAWSYLLRPEFLNDLFTRNRGRSYEDILDFPTFVALIRDALILHRGSGLASFERAEEQGELPTCQEAVYAKLRRVPPGSAWPSWRRSPSDSGPSCHGGPRPRPCRRRWTASRS